MRIPKFVWGVVALVLVAGAAFAGWMIVREKESQRSGTCDAAVYQLSVEEDDGVLEVNFELTSSAPGEVWDVVVQQNNTLLLEGQRTTDEDAELDVDVPVRSNGKNEFTVTATPEGGEACTAQLRHG